MGTNRAFRAARYVALNGALIGLVCLAYYGGHLWAERVASFVLIGVGVVMGLIGLLTKAILNAPDTEDAFLERVRRQTRSVPAGLDFTVDALFVLFLVAIGWAWCATFQIVAMLGAWAHWTEVDAWRKAEAEVAK